MKRVIIIFAVTVVSALSAYGYDAVIQSDCIHVNELLGDEYPAIQIQCGFLPGDLKMLPSNVVATTLKRSNIAVPEMPANFKVKRDGKRLTEDTVKEQLEKAYGNKYPERIVQIEAVRFTKEIYLSSGADYELAIDIAKFGPAYGTVNAGSAKAGFSYTAKIFEEGYVATDRIRVGDSVAGKVSTELIDVTNLRGTLVTDPADIIASKSINRGKVLTTDLVSARPDRTKGDAILLTYNDSTIKLEITGIAEGNAVIGKTFPVRNPSSGKVFSAIYQGNGRAVVHH